MNVFIVSHDQGVDGGRAVNVFQTFQGAVTYVEKQKLTQYPKLEKIGDRVWDSLGDTFYIDEFEVLK